MDRIEVMDDGPYVVRGDLPLQRRAPVSSGEGEPLAWDAPRPVEMREKYRLCRCGASADKPFCDGSHREAGFDGTCSLPDAPYEERADDLGGSGITVHDDRSICEHAGFCGNKMSNVWKMISRTDDVQVRTAVIGMIEKCPSGALTYELDGDAVEPDYEAAVNVVDDGPLWITGRIPISLRDGTEVEVRNRVTLCRCGASGNKPLCDGSHANVDFADS